MKTHKFKQRLLRKLTKRDIPAFMCFTDTETHSEVTDIVELQLFSIGWIFCWDSSKQSIYENVSKDYFTDAGKYCKFFETIVKDQGDIHIYGHNLFFDLQCAGFFKYFTSKGWKCDWLYDKGLTYILRITKNKLSITCVSTTNYYDCSLKALGEMIGLKKKEISFATATGNQLKSYCYRDTEIVMCAVWYYLEFIQKHDLGRMTLTKASQGFVAYRTRFMTNKIYLHSEQSAFDLERLAYTGGRVEAFRIGQVPGSEFVMLDVNSMYPYVMKKFTYPSKLVAMINDEPRIKYEQVLGGYGMVAEVEIETDEPVYAVKHKGKLVFPIGTFKAFLATEGIKYALAHDHIKKFNRANVYLMSDLFSDYVDYFMDLRLKYDKYGNKIMVKLCKYMHNAFYGKWGERDIITDSRYNDTDIEYLRREIIDPVTGQTWVETYFMNQIIMQHYEGEGSNSFPAIAAHITENARLQLWNIINTIGAERVLYCDTDSVIVHADDMSRVKDLMSETELGGLKVQSSFDSLLIEGAKNYRTGDERHIKGIPKSAIEVSHGVFTYDSFQRQVSCLRTGQIVGVKVSPVTRSLKHTYDKGNITSSGVVEPFRFQLLEEST
jgi:hypothetical protein